MSEPEAVIVSPWGPPRTFVWIAFGLCLLDFLWIGLGTDRSASETTFTALLAITVLVQIACAIVAIVMRVRRNRVGQPRSVGAIIAGAAAIVVSAITGLVGVTMIALAHLFTSSGGGGGFGLGGAWGRPLRVRGRQLHPSLKRGADWTRGPRPDPRGMDDATRRALEALWLHDAQKEHASVPAFARVTWLLAAAGGPAELMTWAHRAGIEEIEHAQACFALAAGYGGRSFTVEPMPDLLLGGLDGNQDPRVTLAIESLSDGCQLEDFNADVAAACAAVCTEPVTRAVLETIAREERGHAELSWAIVAWLVREHGTVVERALRDADRALDRYPRPTAVADDKRALVAAASPELLRAHGRLPDAAWQACWDARVIATRARLAELQGESARVDAAA